MLIMITNLLGIRLYLKTSLLIQPIWFEQPLGTLLILSFTNKLMKLQWEAQHLQPQQEFICRLMKGLQYIRHGSLQKFGNGLLMTFILPLNVCTWKTSSIISTILIKILSLLCRNKVMENQRFLTLYINRIKERSLYQHMYKKPKYTDQYLHYSSHQQTSSKESVVSFLFNRAYSIITNKDDLNKESARIRKLLKENGYQESIISKIFKRITNNRSLPQSQQLTEATDIQ